MELVEHRIETRPPRRFAVTIVESGPEIKEAQSLRWQVFAGLGGAQLSSTAGEHDVDAFDPYCAHILVRDTSTEKVIGTYRILTGTASRSTGGFYSETEFNLDRLEHLRPRIAELGRSCVHPSYRSGAVIALLWGAIADYVASRGCDVLIGCASVPMSDGGHAAASLYRQLAADDLAPPEYRVTPRTPVTLPAVDRALRSTLPPLVKGYLRAGAWVCGPPHWDPDFNTADFLMMLRLDQLDKRYARHYRPNREA